MKRKWHTKTWKMTKKDYESWSGAMAGYVDPGEFASDIYPNGDYAHLFVYMFRRFGIPENGSDDYKEIACWYITTPDPNVALIVSPRPTGLRYSFGYWINANIYPYHSQDADAVKVEYALKEAMKDLLTPTNVRDEYLNAVGNVEDENLGKTTCKYWKWAGYGVTADYYKKFKRGGLQ